MKRLANALVPALSVAIGVTHPAIVSAQSPHDSAAHGPAVGEELIVTYVTSRYGPGALRSTSTVRLELVANDSHQLVGRSRGQLLVIDARSIRRVKRRIGTRPASAPVMVAGSAAGFAAGFLIGATSSAGGSQVSGGRSAADDGLVAGVLVGAPLGAFVAWVASRSRPIYEDLGIGDVRPSVRVAPTGQVGLAISIPTG